jgi:hypothetical protein
LQEVRIKRLDLRLRGLNSLTGKLTALRDFPEEPVSQELDTSAGRVNHNHDPEVIETLATARVRHRNAPYRHHRILHEVVFAWSRWTYRDGVIANIACGGLEREASKLREQFGGDEHSVSEAPFSPQVSVSRDAG